jgi:hypothetical protein
MMKRKFFSVLLFFLCGLMHGQGPCADKFISDTMSVPLTGKTVAGEFLETSLKDGTIVRFFKTNSGQYYLRFMISKNFYFNQVSTLEIQSNTKSFYVKNAKQYKVSKSQGMFILEIFRHYVSTIKQEGITAIVFGEVETKFTKQDALQIKDLATCFYETIAAKKEVEK